MKILMILAVIVFGVNIYLDFKNDKSKNTLVDTLKRSGESPKIQREDVMQQAAVDKSIPSEATIVSEEDFFKKDQDLSREVIKEATRDLENLSRKEVNKTPPRPRFNEKGEVNNDPTEMPF